MSSTHLCKDLASHWSAICLNQKLNLACCSATASCCRREEEDPKDHGCSPQPPLQKPDAAQAARRPSPPRAAHRTLSLSIAPTPPPTHYAVVGSHSREGSCQADDGQAASKELPDTSLGTAAAPQPSIRVKNRCIFQAPLACHPLHLGHHFSSCPSWDWRWEEPPSGLTPLSSVIQDSRRTSQPLDWWDANRHVQLPFDTHRLETTAMRQRLWACEVERSRSQFKATCQSWRDVSTDVQARWRRES